MSLTFSRSAVAALLLAASSAFAVDVSFRQLNWLNDDGSMGIFASQVGEAEFHFDASNPDDQIFLLPNGGGYINVVMQPNDEAVDWVVQNLYISYPDPAFMMDSSPSVQFHLPIAEGEIVEFTLYEILVTPEPLIEPPFILDNQSPVELVDYHVGGFAGGGSGLAITPFIIGPWIGPFPGTLPIDWAWTWLPGDLIDTVDEDLNGCAPGSASRSIEYLGWVGGFATGSAQDIYDQLKNDMHTGPDGTSDPDMLSGKQSYTDRNGLPICTELVYNFAEQIDNIMQCLRDGGDIEILISWNGGGGHAAMITQIVKHSDGSYTITYVDDPTQGDGNAENEEHVIHVAPDGTFAGGTVDGFMVEKVCKVPGDVDGDGDVDQADLGALLGAYGTEIGDDDYNPDADFDHDGDVDQADLGVLLGNYGFGT